MAVESTEESVGYDYSRSGEIGDASDDRCSRVEARGGAATGDETAFSVVMDGNDLGKVAFMKYYKPVAEELDP